MDELPRMKREDAPEVLAMASAVLMAHASPDARDDSLDIGGKLVAHLGMLGYRVIRVTPSHELPEPDWELMDSRSTLGGPISHGKAQAEREQMHQDWHHEHPDRFCEHPK